MSHDCYCVICGGPLYAWIRIGKKIPRALSRRAKNLSKEKKRRAGIRPPYSEDEGEPPRKPASKADLQNAEEDDGYNSRDEWQSYDPRLVTEEGARWLGKCRALAFNLNATSVAKTYITGRGTYDDYGAFRIREPGDDPNDPGDREVTCIYTFNTNEVPAFPFHEECYRVLSRSLLGEDGMLAAEGSGIDKDMLYGVFTQLTPAYGGYLDVDYGDITGMEQFWESHAGEEYAACTPALNPDIRATIETMMAGKSFARAPTNLDLEHRVRSDPLATLPHDIFYLIFPHLSAKDTFALMEGSWHVYDATRNNGFWKQMIRRHILSWFWEIESLSEMEVGDDFDWKAMYLWLNKLTKPVFGMQGPFMGIANRRRLWKVCEAIRDIYWKEKAEESKNAGKHAEVANNILLGAFSLEMPLLTFPRANGSKIMSSHWIQSWNDLGNANTFESFWSCDEHLVGLAVTIGSDRRLLGQGESAELGITRKAISIPGNQWINEIILHISDVDMYEREQRKASVKALSVTLTSGKVVEVVPAAMDLNKRVLTLAQGMHLVGLVGTTAVVPKSGSRALNIQKYIEFPPTYSGTITRLGLLQCAHPDTPKQPGDEGPKLVQASRFLWHPSASRLPCNDPILGPTCPIWSHPYIRMLPFELTPRWDETPYDVHPHHALLWASNPFELKYLKRISAFVVEIGTRDSGNKKEPYHGILGLRVEFHDGFGEKFRAIGSGRLPPSYALYNSNPTSTPEPPSTTTKNEPDTSEEWPEANLEHFNIDGPGGEIITSIYASEESKVIKLQTNRGRECWWGESDHGSWHFTSRTTAPGDILLGLVVSFAGLTKWSNKEKKYQYLRTSTVTGLVTNLLA